MSGPWFRRYFFSFKPTSWQGWLVMGVTAAVGLPCLFAADYFDTSRPLLSSIFGGAAVLTFCASFAVTVWKTDWGYGRR